jgi:hypothetical protein
MDIFKKPKPRLSNIKEVFNKYDHYIFDMDGVLVIQFSFKIIVGRGK